MANDVSALVKQVDVTNLYRRAEVERRIARGIVDGRDEAELCDMLGLPSDDVTDIVNRLSVRVQAEAVEIARVQAIKQTGALTSLYMEAERRWRATGDPRYAEQMRGALADIRKIWGVDAPQRVALGGTLNVRGGVLGGILAGIDEGTLRLLSGIFEGSDGGSGSDGAGVSEVKGLCEVGGAVPLDRGEPHRPDM